MSLQSVLKNKNAPYDRFPPLTIKIVALKKKTKVSCWDICGSDLRPLSRFDNYCAAISDGSTVMKMVLFEDLVAGAKEGGTYIIKNYGVSSYGGQSLLCRRNTAFFRAVKEVHVPPSLEQQAHDLLAPPAPYKRLSELTSATESLVSVKGLITSVSF